MLATSAVRALVSLALSILACGAAAMPVNPVERAELLATEQWPQARWADAPSFVATALPGLSESSSLDPPPLLQPWHDPTEKAAFFMALLTRHLVPETQRPEHALGLDVALTLGFSDESGMRSDAGLSQLSSSSSGLYGARSGTTTVATASAVAIETVAFSAAAPAWQRGAAYPSFSQGQSQSPGMGLDSIPLHRIQLLPWIGFALGVVAIGWIGWRAAG
jgi:hypothetical protein